MRKVLAVIRREFVERVRSKWFWVSAILVPLFLAAVILLPAAFASSGGPKRIVVLDGTGSTFGQRVTEALRAGPAFQASRVAASPGVIDSLMREVGAKRLDGVLVLAGDVVRTGAAEYRATNVSSLRDIGELRRVLGSVVTTARLERAGIDPAVMARAEQPITLATQKISGSATTGESSAQSFSLAYFMGIILYMVILMYGVNVKSSVLEEKTTRIVEVLVSSIRPFALLCGKVVGVGAVSLLQLAIWAVAGRVLFSQRAALAGRMGGLETDGGLFQMPHVSCSRCRMCRPPLRRSFSRISSAAFCSTPRCSPRWARCRRASRRRSRRSNHSSSCWWRRFCPCSRSSTIPARRWQWCCRSCRFPRPSRCRYGGRPAISRRSSSRGRWCCSSPGLWA